jgi:hypothetical protein
MSQLRRDNLEEAAVSGESARQIENGTVSLLSDPVACAERNADMAGKILLAGGFLGPWRSFCRPPMWLERWVFADRDGCEALGPCHCLQ